MCEFRAASYRFGTVVESKDGEGNRCNLSISDAMSVGRAIRTSRKKYINVIKTAILSAVDAHGAALGLTPDDLEISVEREDNISARFDPGLILDFPRLQIEGPSGNRIELRSCLTVCVGALKSKIWTRMTTIGDWGEIDQDSLAALHDFFEAMGMSANDGIRLQYEEDFRKRLSPALTLEAQGNFHVFATDVGGKSATDTLEVLCDRLRYDRESVQAVEDPEVADALRQVTTVSLSPEGRDASATPEFRIGDGSEFFPFRGVNRAGSVFVNTISGSDAYFAGIVNGDTSVRPEWFEARDGDPNGTGTTAELAAFLGSQF